jgi:hypothetical protein
VRGAALGIYPYPFLDVAKLGYVPVFMNAAALLAVFFVLGTALTAIDQALSSYYRRRSRLGSAVEL